MDKRETYHGKLHEIEPWRRREVARNTGRKCEKPGTSRGYNAARRAEAKAAVRRETRRQIAEAL